MAWRGVPEVLGSSDFRLQIFEHAFLARPDGLVSRVGNVALPTSFGGKGPHLKQ